MQPIRLISFPVHCQKGNPLLIVGIHGILSPGFNALCQVLNLAIFGLINLPTGCPRFVSCSILRSEYYTVAVMGNIELFGTTVRGNRTVGSQTSKLINITFHSVHWRVKCFWVECRQGLGEV